MAEKLKLGGSKKSEEEAEKESGKRDKWEWFSDKEVLELVVHEAKMKDLDKVSEDSLDLLCPRSNSEGRKLFVVALAVIFRNFSKEASQEAYQEMGYTPEGKPKTKNYQAAIKYFSGYLKAYLDNSGKEFHAESKKNKREQDLTIEEAIEGALGMEYTEWFGDVYCDIDKNDSFISLVKEGFRKTFATTKNSEGRAQKRNDFLTKLSETVESCRDE